MMIYTRKSWPAATLVAAILATTTAWAATDSSLPPERTNGPVTYISGGIGQDEAAAMKQAAANYPLQLQFVEGTEPPVPYLAQINVTIKDKAGRTVLDTRSEGPFLLARLPDGGYTISAENSGQTKSRNVVVDHSKRQAVIFVWKD